MKAADTVSATDTRQTLLRFTEVSSTFVCPLIDNQTKKVHMITIAKTTN